jgi:hypothetical protein
MEFNWEANTDSCLDVHTVELELPRVDGLKAAELRAAWGAGAAREEERGEAVSISAANGAALQRRRRGRATSGLVASEGRAEGCSARRHWREGRTSVQRDGSRGEGRGLIGIQRGGSGGEGGPASGMAAAEGRVEHRPVWLRRAGAAAEDHGGTGGEVNRRPTRRHLRGGRTGVQHGIEGEGEAASSAAAQG